MDDNSELTNVPDYQKIMQTSQSVGGQGTNTGLNTSSGWNEEVETLTPSPVVRHPITSTSGSPQQMLQQQQQRHRYGNYSQNAWEGKQTTSASAANTSLGTTKASWEAQPQYNASKYGLVHPSNSMSSFNDESSYLPQGYTRPVTKYIDVNGVERRFIRRNVSPNRRSYTEGFMLGDNPELSVYQGAGLRTASSQKNLHQDYPATTSNFKRDLGSYNDVHEGRPLQRNNFSQGGYLSQNMGYSTQGHQQVPAADDQWKEIGGHMPMKAPQDDLRHWQQQHQEETLHQHLETQALYESPSNQAHHVPNIEQSLGKMTVHDEPPARWEPVRRAADNIIREKNMIIDKLKNRILELEEDFKVSESNLRQALMTKEDDADIIKQKLQEMQHKHATLRERLNEERAKKNSEIDDLELKLGSAEHEVQQLKEMLRNKDLGVSDVQAQLEEKSQEADAWRDKFIESRNSHQDMKKKLDSLQHYLNELPTVEESRVQAQQIMSLREENLSLKNKVEGLEKKVTQMRKGVTSRDFRIRELEQREKELQEKIEEVTQELDQLRDTEGSEFYNMQRELEHARSDKERLAIDLEKAKKLLETTHQKLKQLEVKYQTDLREAQERLEQEEQTVVSLRAAELTKDEQMEKMRKAMKDLGIQNQELLEQTLLVKEQVRHMEAKSTDTSLVLQRRFMIQLSLCFSELQALVQVCSQRARGEDPDISVLLGVKNMDLDEQHEGGAAGGEGASEGADSKTTMTQWLGRLAELRKEVDRLRAHICNRYAEDMGDNITCATQ